MELRDLGSYHSPMEEHYKIQLLKLGLVKLKMPKKPKKNSLKELRLIVKLNWENIKDLIAQVHQNHYMLKTTNIESHY